MSPTIEEAAPATAKPAASVEPRAPASALATRFGVVAVLVALDLWSKSAAFTLLERLEREDALVLDPCAGPHARLPLVGEWFAFMPSLNPGAAFGHFHQIPWLLVGGRVAAALFLTWLVLRAPLHKRVSTSALVLVLAGALGNLYDNLLRERDLLLDRYYADRTFMPVRDFIDVYFERFEWHFPTFNVADSCITVGAVLLLAVGLFQREPKTSA